MSRASIDHRGRKVAFFPSVSHLSKTAYWPILAIALEQVGVHLVHDTPPQFDFSWLMSNRGRVDILNIHFFQGFYKGRFAFAKVLRFGFLMVLARMWGYRTVFTLHNLEATYPIKPAWVDYLGHWIAANLSNRVIVYCDKARRLLAEKYGRKRRVYRVDHPNVVGYYPNTVSSEEARRMLGISPGQLVFTFFGGSTSQQRY